jgi:hypothetical protein
MECDRASHQVSGVGRYDVGMHAIEWGHASHQVSGLGPSNLGMHAIKSRRKSHRVSMVGPSNLGMREIEWGLASEQVRAGISSIKPDPTKRLRGRGMKTDDHAPVPFTARPRQFVPGERGHDRAGADRVDPRTTLPAPHGLVRACDALLRWRLPLGRRDLSEGDCRRAGLRSQHLPRRDR